MELRAVAADEIDELVRVDNWAFSSAPPDAERMAEIRRFLEPERTRVVFEGGRMVAASASLTFELTVPGRTVTPAAGITYVGVIPTHRRRGHLTRMMGALLDDAAEREEPVAVLLASESVIYGRFGYGLASSHVSTEIASRYAGFRPEAPSAGGRIELLDGEAAGKVVPGVLDAARRLQPGDIRRPDAAWENILRDPEQARDGYSTVFYAVHESTAGEADGYAAYRVKHTWENGLADGRVRVDELVATSTAAEADLWRYLFSVDLTETVECEIRPVDDPLRWMLADPRRLRFTMVADYLFSRLIDVPAALAARRYAVDGALVLEVHDAFRPGAGGRFRLDGGPHGAECRRTTDEPDLSLSAEDLGALYLGGVRASTLAAAGRVTEHRPGALGRADAMLLSTPAPFCRTHF
ncbi:MAG TPA: GNAT family N-acetyltransferase [Acidimicrobiales bacterium]|nr:GNAT family N-acetyltransferase [Acidimicrobiales bacterium]